MGRARLLQAVRHAPVLPAARHGRVLRAAGAFESQDFELATQIYIDRKPGYYDFANQTPTMTEAEVIAQYASPQE